MRPWPAKRWLLSRATALSVTVAVNLLLILAMARLNGYAKTKRPVIEKPTPVRIPLVKRKLTQRRSEPKRLRSAGPKRRSALPTLNIPSSVQLPAWDDVTSDRDPVEHVEALRHAPARQEIFNATAVDEPPRVLQSEPPRYPAGAEAQGIEGEVVARILVDAEGRVRQVIIISSRPAGTFDRAATEALLRWSFTPAKLQGRAVKVWARKRVFFKLH